MRPEDRIEALSELGKYVAGLSVNPAEELITRAVQENPWFSPENISMALEGIGHLLVKKALVEWMSGYFLPAREPKKIGIAMAGNIPLVGFHDFLCVLISGNKVCARLSSQDSVLLSHLADQLIKIEPGFAEYIQFTYQLDQADAVIATGSDNTSRYFEFYFRNVPHIIRKNRSSCAVISGQEIHTGLQALGVDVFSYFGLGCRNVSKLYVPAHYDLTKLFSPWDKFRSVIRHHKYFNNYRYQKSIRLVNRAAIVDSGFTILVEEDALVSPLAVLYFEYYTDPQDLQQKLATHVDKIQCILSQAGLYPGSERFGEGQFPRLSDYADNVDTMKFLISLGS